MSSRTPGLAPEYDRHHGVSISDAVLVPATRPSDRYISEYQLPRWRARRPRRHRRPRRVAIPRSPMEDQMLAELSARDRAALLQTLRSCVHHLGAGL